MRYVLHAAGRVETWSESDGTDGKDVSNYGINDIELKDDFLSSSYVNQSTDVEIHTAKTYLAISLQFPNILDQL